MGKDANGRFESPRFLANWANEEIQDLESQITEFFDSEAYGIFTQLDLYTGYVETKMRGIKPQPAKWRGATSNIIKNLKDALDQATFHASSIVVGKDSHKATHFPFGENPDDLENSLTGKRAPQCKNIPPELFPVLRRCEPYPTGYGYAGGNDALKLLAKVAGSHKHRITLNVAPRVLNWRLEPPPGSTNVIIRSNSSLGSMEIMNWPWDSVKNEMMLVRAPFDLDAHVNFKFGFSVTFSNSALNGIDVVPFLRTCQASVAKIVDDLETEAVKIGGQR